jgi:RimJ/RimL family protein N-acetyltransferase
MDVSTMTVPTAGLRDLTGVTLTTERLRLAPPTEADVDVITEACQDPHIQSWLFIPLPFTREAARYFVTEVIPREMAAGTGVVFGIYPKDSAELLGMLSLSDITAPDSRDGSMAEAGCWAAPAARRNHYVMEAGLEMCRWAFGALGIQRLEMMVCAGNDVAVRGAQKYGFKVEGVLRSRRVLRGERVDMWVGSMLPSDLP